ncbi:MAG: hypothetical protein QGG54_04890 [Gammaproteobacteria bacterium]|jgi:hypothetical protein|nr:hypothetical protein [Gammaproteobacteria bacterium]MDP6536194.1 hypothetical protein [Gammaproteobacteria bacterium]MDP6732847.1 hypothetical protein [Gammaproteobacteria bacterium]HAJ76920.1 hypothetical protein [Gammaproteobacteria bacterium]|tara:strand:- start:1154 stop:1429 length:276 start_codon:yes stop_codon:yes gene_type:complete
MLFLASWIAPIVFWFYVFRLTRLIGYRIPGLFAVLWGAAFLGQSILGIYGGLYFITFESILAVVLIMMHLYVSQTTRGNADAFKAREQAPD